MGAYQWPGSPVFPTFQLVILTPTYTIFLDTHGPGLSLSPTKPNLCVQGILTRDNLFIYKLSDTFCELILPFRFPVSFSLFLSSSASRLSFCQLLPLLVWGRGYYNSIGQQAHIRYFCNFLSRATPSCFARNLDLVYGSGMAWSTFPSIFNRITSNNN